MFQKTSMEAICLHLSEHLGPLLLTWITFGSQHGKVITSIIKYGMKLRIHFQTSTVAPLKFGNVYIFHPKLYWTCNYLSMLVLKLTHVNKKGPLRPVYMRQSGLGNSCLPELSRSFLLPPGDGCMDAVRVGYLDIQTAKCFLSFCFCNCCHMLLSNLQY